MAHKHIIKEIEPGSIAMELGIEPGDRLLSINDMEMTEIPCVPEKSFKVVYG